MIQISKQQQNILLLMLQQENVQSSQVHAALQVTGEHTALVTVKRALSDMREAGVIATMGAGPATRYVVTPLGRIIADINASEYCSFDPDKRYGLQRYNFDALSALPTSLLSASEYHTVQQATEEYHHRTADISEVIQKKELARLIIELAWKSSRIEGNTYTLLDTEKLILENQEAFGHDKNEARMILNHKEAFTFVYEHAAEFHALTKANVESLHAILVKDLSVGLGFRKQPVGVLGSKYQPLDNIHQITDAMATLMRVVNGMIDPYSKALAALAGISYIQPFEDGNKRTSRLMANALLLAYGCAPLSYRSVDEREYRDAMLVWYEVNSLVPLKKIFIGQYDFAARNYAV